MRVDGRAGEGSAGSFSDRIDGEGVSIGGENHPRSTRSAPLRRDKASVLSPFDLWLRVTFHFTVELKGLALGNLDRGVTLIINKAGSRLNEKGGLIVTGI